MLYKLYINQSILNLDIVFLKHDKKPFDYSHAQNGTSHFHFKIKMSHVVPTCSLLLHCPSFLKSIFSSI